MGNTILIVEDDQAIRGILANAFRKRGFEVAEAGDGQSGSECVTSDNKYAIILLDIMMPLGGGERVLKSLRNQDKDCPSVIIMTNLAEAEARKIVNDYQVEEIITKANHKLRDIVENVIGKVNGESSGKAMSDIDV